MCRYNFKLKFIGNRDTNRSWISMIAGTLMATFQATENRTRWNIWKWEEITSSSNRVMWKETHRNWVKWTTSSQKLYGKPARSWKMWPRESWTRMKSLWYLHVEYGWLKAPAGGPSWYLSLRNRNSDPGAPVRRKKSAVILLLPCSLSATNPHPTKRLRATEGQETRPRGGDPTRHPTASQIGHRKDTPHLPLRSAVVSL